MPAWPGAPLIRLQAARALAPWKAGVNPGARLDDPRPRPKSRLLERPLAPRRGRAGRLLALPGVLRGGIPRGAGLPGTVGRAGPPGHHRPRRGSGPCALDPCLPPAWGSLPLPRPLLPVSPCQRWPHIGGEGWSPRRHRVPRGLGRAAASWLRGPRGLQGPPRRGARDAQPVALTALAPRVATPRVAAARLSAGPPALRPLRPPGGPPRQARRVPRVRPPRLGDRAGRAAWCGPRPRRRPGQTPGAPGVIVTRHGSHTDAALAVVTLAPVTPPRAVAPHRGRAPLGQAPGSQGAAALGVPQPLGPLSPEDLAHRLVVPWRSADAGLPARSLHIAHRRAVLGRLPRPVGPQPLEGAVDVAVAGLGLQRSLRGPHAVAQPLHHGGEHVGGNAAIAHACLASRCPRRCHLCASSPWHADTGCGWEAIETTRG